MTNAVNDEPRPQTSGLSSAMIEHLCEISSDEGFEPESDGDEACEDGPVYSHIDRTYMTRRRYDELYGSPAFDD